MMLFSIAVKAIENSIGIWRVREYSRTRHISKHLKPPSSFKTKKVSNVSSQRRISSLRCLFIAATRWVYRVAAMNIFASQRVHIRWDAKSGESQRWYTPSLRLSRRKFIAATNFVAAMFIHRSDAMSSSRRGDEHLRVSADIISAKTRRTESRSDGIIYHRCDFSVTISSLRFPEIAVKKLFLFVLKIK